ncbi:MAG: PAS domain-containing protein [Planctomycetota bacterium]
MPARSVRALARTPDGFLWIGTTGGLCRFDGLEFRRYPAREFKGLAADRILALFVASDGALWVGTDRGASVLRDGRFLRVVRPEDSEQVVAFFEDESGVWGAGDGLFRLAGDVFESVPLGAVGASDRSPAVNSVLPIEEGALVSTAAGLHEVRGGTVTELCPEPAAGCFRDAGGALWVAFARAARIAPLADLDDRRPVHRLGRLYASVQTSDDTVYVAAAGGLHRAVGSGSELRLEAVTRRIRPRAFLQCEGGGLWVGTRRSGLASLAAAEFEQVPLPWRREEEPAVGLVVPYGNGGALVASVEGRDVWTYGTEGAVPVAGTRPLLSGVLSWAAPLPGGAVLGLDAAGVLRFDADGAARILSFDTKPERPKVTARLLPGPERSAWLWREGMLERIDADGVVVARVPDFGPAPSAANPAAGGMVLLAGSSVLRVDTDRFTGIDRDVPLLAPPVEVARVGTAPLRACVEDERGDLWITTYGEGLARLTPSGRVDRWTTSDGLVDDYLGAVAVARDRDGVPRLWLNSNVGVFAVTFESLDAALVSSDASLVTRRIPTPEGNGVSGCAVGDGGLLFPTIEGLTRVQPSELRLQRPAPGLVLESVLVDGEPHDLAAGVAPDATVEFRYAGIDLPARGGLVFQHRLVGFDARWLDAGTQRVARYVRLPRGNYRFQLRARARDGAWSPVLEAPDAILVPSRWHERPGVRTLGALGVLFLVVLVARMRARSRRERLEAVESEIRLRRAVEAELSRSRSEYVAVLKAAYDGILSVDRHWTIHFANDAASELLGRPAEELLGAGLDRAGLGDLRADIAELLRGFEPGTRRASSSAGDDRSAVDSSIERADGSRVAVEATFAWDAAGAELDSSPRLTIVLRDVTDKRLMVEALRRGEARFRTLFRTIPTPVFVWKPSLQLVDWNDKAAASFGFDDGDVNPPVLLDLFPASAPIERFRLAIERVLGGTPRVSTVHPARTASGEDRLYRWSFAPLLQEDGSIYAVLTLATDITEDEQIAADLEALRGKVVRAEESERARIARELHDDLSQRLAALALEIQIGSVPATLSDATEVQAVFERVQRGIEEVAHDVHALSRRLHPTVLDDLGLARALRSECEQRSRRYGVPVEFFDRAGDAAPDHAVALTILRIAQEAVQNACKHASATEVQVDLELAPVRSIRLTVHDDGCGFDTSATTASSSAGIGIASMEERARLVGGELSVVSREGWGTTVSVVAPLGSGAERTDAYELPSVRPRAAGARVSDRDGSDVSGWGAAGRDS